MAASSIAIQQGNLVDDGRGMKCNGFDVVQLASRVAGLPLAPPQPHVTFLIYLLSRGVTTSSVPVSALPVVQRSIRERDNHSKVSTKLCVPGNYLFRVVAAGCNIPLEVVEQKFRIIVQGRQVSPDSFIAIDDVVGYPAEAALRGLGGCESKDDSASVRWSAGGNHALCSLWVVLRLLGGKGGFGALLKKQRRKRRANFSVDACRDLTGRRLRQAEAVSRIKAWMERKRKEEAVIASLAQQTSDQLRIQEQRPEIALDPAYLSEQASQASKVAGLVAQGMTQQRKLREREEARLRKRTKKPQNISLLKQLSDALRAGSDDDDWSDTNSDAEPDSESEPVEDSTEVVCSSRDTIRQEAVVPSSGSSSCTTTSNKTRSNESQERSCRSADPGATSTDMVSPASSCPVATVNKVQLSALSALKELEALRRTSVGNVTRNAVDVEAKKTLESSPAELVSAEAQKLDPTKFNSVDELILAVKPEVIKEKLRQLGWKCGGRPEERAIRLMHLKTVDLHNVPKSLLARSSAPSSRG